MQMYLKYSFPQSNSLEALKRDKVAKARDRERRERGV
jgi:hypothetical protein